VVLYDQTTDHWILSQFTTRGLDAQVPNYNCVAVSVTGDATGAYYRYAFPTQADNVDGGYFFPDYPKYGVWSNSYIMTTRDFGWVDRYGISVYALEKNKMVNGDPNARAVQFFLEANVTPTGTTPLEDVGDGLLPPDIDGNKKPPTNVSRSRPWRSSPHSAG
jgi:phospholipase C